MSWDGRTAEWWTAEVADDAAYRGDVDPLLQEVLPPDSGGLVVDIGCGDGRLAGTVPRMVGVDRSRDLARAAASRLPVVVADAARLPLAMASAAGALAVLVLEHLPEIAPFFEETARVVAPGGFLAAVVNHPVYTAPGSGPFVDPADGEVLWRWGSYLTSGSTDEPAGSGTVRFHHHPLGALLSAAANAGWALERLEERALHPGDDPLLAAQEHVPRLLGLRWRRVG